jgi:transposase
MATIQKRKSRGCTYWYIVESRRVNGKPRPITLAYLGKAEDLFSRLSSLQTSFVLKSYSHGDTRALLNIANEINVVEIINKYIPVVGKSNKQPMRDGLTVGASFLLAAIGRACLPTSKLSWHDWCRQTSLEYCLNRSFKKLDSQHFWDQMNCLPVDKIPLIEKELIEKMVDVYHIKPDCLFFDTTNIFTFIDSGNERCDLPQRGKNKQKRNDLRQFGVALLVTRKEQFPLFHKTYQGNLNDITFFKNNFKSLAQRLRDLFKGLSDITLVFDKGNNSKVNLAMLDEEKELHYVIGLIPSHFKNLIHEANKHFELLKINETQVPIYRLETEIWGARRTCVITISTLLKEGQIKGIHQHLSKKYKALDEFKVQLENPKKRKKFNKEELKKRLDLIIKGQFIDEILKYDFIELKDESFSFTYYVDNNAFVQLKKEVLGRKILATNRHDWTNEEIIQAYKGQSKVEYAFRNIKNPYHLAIRPQFHWTDQKIEVHVLICIIGYLLAIAAYTKARNAGYQKNIDNFLDDLRTIRLASYLEKKPEGRKGKLKTNYLLEKIDEPLIHIADKLGISNQNIRLNLNFSVYN